jgi:hypothetical protein
MKQIMMIALAIALPSAAANAATSKKVIVSPKVGINESLTPTSNVGYDIGSVDYAWNKLFAGNDFVIQTQSAGTGLKGGVSWITERPYSDEMAYIRIDRTGSGGAPADIVFGTTNSAPTVTEKMRITSDGLTKLTGLALQFPGATSDPSSPAAGWVYFNTSSNKLRLYDGSAWVNLN